MFTDSTSSSCEHKIHFPNLFTVILGPPEECEQKWCIPLLGLVPKMLCMVFDALFPLLIWLSSVWFSRSVMSDFLWSRGQTCFSVHHQLLELTQTHVHRVSRAIQPSHPLLSPSPPVFSLSQHQGLFQWAGSSHQVAKVLEFQLQHQSFQWIFRTDFL